MLKLYNTLTRQKQEFIPIDPKNVRLYVCGMTVYDLCHLGHARVLVVFDVLARWLRHLGYPLTYVRNITDIDDKIIQRAAENHESLQSLTQRYIQAMREDSLALGVVPPDHEPLATNYITQMIALIEQLMAVGHAYIAENGDVCYAVRHFEGYGKLSGKNLDTLRAGERVEVADGKRDPLDFVLWKSAKAEEPAEAKWDSPWGSGRPGWHIECSAMSSDLLGEHFDIHGGGQDLQFPHHENEIAQSEGAHGHFVNYWLHNGFVRIDNEKMSKSLGNFFTIRQVLAEYDAEVVRFFILRAHYRSPLNYSDTHLDDARHGLSRLYTALRAYGAIAPELDRADVPCEPYIVKFYAAMNDDLATPEAIAVLFDLASEINRQQQFGDARTAEKLAATLKALAGILGLLQRDPQEFLQSAPRPSSISVAEIEAQIQARLQAKAAKDYKLADQLRQELASQGVVLEDSSQGTTWRWQQD